MGSKIKPRQQQGDSRRRAPKGERSLIVKDMLTRGGAGRHSDKRERRQNNPKRIDWDTWED